MAFKSKAPAVAMPEDPVDLYRILAETNSGPSALWLHQGDVLRSWHANHKNDPDVAIELPTGAGKTLVGGLIGEYLRRVDGQRVAYLCLTRQLARQTTAALEQYGIPTSLLIGQVVGWNAADRYRYTAGDAVAVSTYSHVFNSNPALNDAQLLLLDDAHSVESYVASPWKLEISRSEVAYAHILDEVADSLDPLVLARLRTEHPDGKYFSQVYLVSPVGVANHAERIEQILSASCAAKTLSDSAQHAYRKITGKVDRCLIYASYSKLLLRPLIAPTALHGAFSDPLRRVYMSATLGAGGELERSFGRRKITRIPIPKGWEKQGTGRRLFCAPELTRNLSVVRTDTDSWVQQMIAVHGRALVLTPDGRTAAEFLEHRIPAGFDVLKADHVEDDLTAFTGRGRAVLLLNNRYDGIDLPDEACRLVIIDGLPAKGDLQERFLYTALGAADLLNERIRSRVVQGAGRATRNARDYATVILLGDDLRKYVARSDVQAAMRPEVHAELDFGLDNSIGLTSIEMAENIEIFRKHDTGWRASDLEITGLRDTLDQVVPLGTTELQAIAGEEVAAWEAIWQGEWKRAFELIRRVLDDLRGGRAPQRYAALWHYLASCVALRASTATGDVHYTQASSTHYADARAAGRGTQWLSYLVAPVEATRYTTTAEVDPLDACAAANILERLPALGRPANFEPEVEHVRTGLGETPAKAYEAALVRLGMLAGAADSIGNNNADAAPDALWTFGEITWVAWEAKSEAQPGGPLGADDVRQAGGHLRYAVNTRGEAAPGDSVVLLISPQTAVHPAARAIAEDHVFLVHPTDVLDLFERLQRAWRTLHTLQQAGITTEDAIRILHAEGALPSQWLPRLRKEPLASQPPPA